MRRSFDWVIGLGPVLLAAAGCSDPVPSSAAAGLSLSIGVSASCPMMTGFMNNLGNPPPSSADSGTPVFNGEGGVSVNCTLRDAGGGSYALQASITSMNPRVSFGLNNATISSSSGKGTGVISIAATSLESPIVSSADAPCTLQLLGIQADRHALWAHYDCSKLTGNPTPVCQAHGEFVIQNCGK